MNVKREYCRESYKETSGKLFKSEAYKSFFNKNKSWLVPYAVFSYLRDKYGTPDFRKWEELSTYNAEAVEAYASKEHDFYDEIA